MAEQTSNASGTPGTSAPSGASGSPAHSTAQKSKKEAIRDRVLGAVMIVAGVMLTVTGLKTGHISMVWPIVGLAGISLFVDSLLKRKPFKIALNVVVILALAAVYFSVRSFNSSHEPAAPEPQNAIEVTE